MVTTFYPPQNFGGDGIAVQRLARALVRRGHEVTVVHSADAFLTLGGKVSAGHDQPSDGVVRIPLRSKSPALSSLLTQQLGAPVVHAKRISRILSDSSIDLIHFHNVSLVGGPGILGMGNGLKFYTAHESWLVCPTHVLWRHQREPCDDRQCLRCVIRHRRPPQLWRYAGKLRRASRHVDTFIALSEFSKAKHAEFGFQRDMVVLPNFLPDAGEPASPAKHERPYFLCVGRLEKLKGVADLKVAFERPGETDLLIAGSGSESARLREMFSGVPRVKFLGNVEQKSLVALYDQAVALIAPNRGYETFGLTLIEAFRSGTPVIARRIGPLPEIVETCGGGLLFDSPEELVEAVRSLESDPGLRASLGESARQGFLDNWEEGVVVTKYLDLVADRLERFSFASQGTSTRARP